MGRFSPTVTPDYEPRRRPGMEIAQAFSDFGKNRAAAQGRATAEEDRQRDITYETEDRATAAEERTRRRGFEDQDQATRDLQFEKMVRDQLGGTPVREGGQEVQGPTPQQAGRAFQDQRESLAQSAEPMARVDAAAAPPEEVAILPGQFAGGTFSPQAVTIGGRQFQIDPSQTLEARTKSTEEAAFQQEVQRLIAAGVDPNLAPVVAEQGLAREFVRPEEEETGFDPDQFPTEQAFLDFRRDLADAQDVAGRRPEKPGEAKGPIDLEGAFVEVDNLFGVFEGEVMVDHKLSAGERLSVARRLASGEITPEEMDELAAEGPEAPEEDVPFQFEAGPVSRFFQGIVPGGKTGLETIGSPVTAAEASEPREETSVLPSKEPPAVDTIRQLIEENRDLSPEDLRGFLLEEFSEAEVDAAFASGR